MKRKTPKVEAWAVVAGAEVLAGFSRESEALSRRLDEAALRSDHTLRVVHLVEADPAREAVVKHAMALLKEHFEANDPYIDDYPSARAAGAEHRKTCRRCAAYLRHLRKQNRAVEKLQKGRRR